MDIARPTHPTPLATIRQAATTHQNLIWWISIVATTVSAAVYLLIGVRAVTVVDNPEDQVAFGLMAGSGYALAALALILIRWRWLYLAGAALQALVMWMYFSLAAERTPSFKFWGIFLRLPQTVLLVALLLLAAAWRTGRRGSTTNGSYWPRNAEARKAGR